MEGILRKRLERKKVQLREMETIGMTTPDEKRNYIVTLEIIRELENILDLAETMFENTPDEDCVKSKK